jgi:hypothetical protein
VGHHIVITAALTLSPRRLLAAVFGASTIVDCTLYQGFDATLVVGRKSVFLPNTGFGRSTPSVVEVCLSSSGLILRLRFYSSVEISMYSLGKLRCNIQIVYRSVPSLASEFALEISSRDALRRRTVLKSEKKSKNENCRPRTVCMSSVRGLERAIDRASRQVVFPIWHVRGWHSVRVLI